MNSFLLALLALVGYILAYHTYGKYLAKRIFKLKDSNLMPSHELEDGVDYVPTKRQIVFGHHFTTIAGLGPIVGPAIGIIWGWLPAFIWVFFGSIFMGAVHDFSSLVISARNKGKTIGELTGDIISPSTRYAFQFIMQFLLFIVISVFSMIVGLLFEMYPEAVFPVWMQIPIAVWLGRQIRKGKNDLLYSIIAVVLMYITVIMGVWIPIKVPSVFGIPPVSIWVLILLVYVYFASTIPVQKLLQPRDYINSHQLIIAMGLMFIGLAVVHPPITAPAINSAATAPGSDIPALAPLLFITIACGAISGFHSLASSGTTVKQVDKEGDTLFIGYGGMLWESLLAVLVLMAIAGGLGITDPEAFNHHYSSWASASGLNAKLAAFVQGAANLFMGIGIPDNIGKSIIAVFIVSFANTTLDSATRIQRLSLQEIFTRRNGEVIKPMDNRYVATFVVVLAAGLLAFSRPAADGAMSLWPLFGSLNQLLAALALAVVSVYLFQRKKKYMITFIPMIFVLAMTIWAMIENLITFFKNSDLVLVVLSGLTLILTIWLMISIIFALIKYKKESFIS
ncbi:MAG: carbon starvation protein A [Bacteroidales bacterium]|nr:carbon starvation protein A [Bacteroidales bacterium]